MASIDKNQNSTRIVSLDYARWIFAFLVVIIHIPVIGGSYIMPIAWCAVPFFYMVTGYFLYDNNPAKIGAKITKALKNYLKIWVISFALLTSIVFILKVIYSNPLGWSLKDITDLFVALGNCQAAELVTIHGISYGTSALWFLYGGVISLALLLGLKRWLFNKTLFFVVVVLYYVSIFINYRNGYVVPRTISASFIFLYVGMLSHKLVCNYGNLLKNRMIILLFITLVLIVGLYVEQFLFHCESYNRFVLLPASFSIFLAILNCKTQCGGVKWLQYIPVKCTLDIYIWHRLLYAVLVGVLGFNFHKMDAVVMFSLLAIVSFVMRKYICLKRCKL